MTKVTPLLTKMADGVIPRSRHGGAAPGWWIAFLGALGALLGLVLCFPDPYWRLIKFLPEGMLVTFEITLSAMVVALLLGLITTYGSISGNRLFRAVASTYIEVVRGIPLLVQLFCIYYALGRLVEVPDMVAAIIAIALCYGGYMSDAVRAGIEAVDKGQIEAARALGFNGTQTMSYVVLPQVWRAILPRVGKEGIALLKDTSLVSILAVADLMRRAHEFAAESFAYVEAYTIVALLYLLITLILSRLVNLMEARLNYRVRA